VGANIVCNNTICVDLESKVISLCNYLKNETYENMVERLDELINYYGLSKSDIHGYEYYGCNSSNGLGKYNKSKYLKLREDYNAAVDKDDSMFLLLVIYSFNNQIRFNSQGKFNLPVGKRDFNLKLRKKLKGFMSNLHNKKISFVCSDFRMIDLYTISKEKGVFFYLDPPYLLGTASYNENNGWNEDDEKDLLNFLSCCNEMNIRFALSNVLEHKGNTNTILLEWCLKNGFNINHIKYNYNNSNYQSNNKEYSTKEVLITNY